MLGRLTQLLVAATCLTAQAHAAPPAAKTASIRAGEGASPTHEQVKKWIQEYKAAHPGRGGKDWDINAKSEEEIASEPDTRRLLSLCGRNQRPVIPQLAWEYGGSDHRWKRPERSALVYCVCTPVAEPSEGWRYDEERNLVVADVSVRFPEQNPCRNATGRDQVMGCIGDPTNLEILVDTASWNDGEHAGLQLSEASTELRLVMPNGKRITIAIAR